MKRIIYTFILSLHVSMVLAQTPTLYGINRNNEPVTTTYHMGDWSACDRVLFECPFVPISNETFLKREWYYNNTRVETNYNANQTAFSWPMQNEGRANTVYCNYITTNSSGATVTRKTNEITVNCNSVGVGIDIQNQAFYGCTTPINLNTREFNEVVAGIKTEAPRVPYTVSWQLPAGWSIQSSTNNNKNIVVIPDKYTGGNLTAIVTLDCGYSMQVTKSISRPMPAAPAFTDFQITICSAGQTRYNATPVCGASSYTFISQNALLPFTNGLTTITTTEPYCDLAYNATSKGHSELSVQANFDNNTSTALTTRPLQFGKPSIYLNPYTWDCNSYTVLVSVKNPSFFEYLDWYRAEDGTYITSGSPVSLPKNGFIFNIQAANACGIYTSKIRIQGGVCPTSFSISPNPVSSNLRVIMPADNIATARPATSEISFKLYNMNTTTLVKSWKAKAGEKEYNFSVADLPKGQYVIHVEGASGKGSQRIIIE
ncbi:T9SS type A sorting domain-containing protein [Filimonas effusa]|uniref:T9SS type A sorting domain-containing protein n=1 Tax=Filimonas effusa TaxID=2508721 RepID=A0A4Q1D1N5_9BACT|nr:T9SS type A sorting domain-containing protein [Filimonas effusa]RXK81200.1 T9SS type A sorting domain-containing protein [Filimonas effusa]